MKFDFLSPGLVMMVVAISGIVYAGIVRTCGWFSAILLTTKVEEGALQQYKSN